MSLAVATALSLPGRLQPTDLRLDAGELVCLIGPNGSGKTSLLHAIAGIGQPGGELLLDGIDPRQLGPVERPRLLGFLPASRDVRWPLSAFDLIRLGGGGEVEAVLTELELEPFRDRRVDRLSTGERSRVLIARVLAPRPRLLLLDEPVANLDPRWQLKLMNQLRASVRQRDRAVLVALHDLELAKLYADRLIVMDKGGIAGDGDPAALLAGPLIPQIFGIEATGEGWRPL